MAQDRAFETGDVGIVPVEIVGQGLAIVVAPAIDAGAVPVLGGGGYLVAEAIRVCTPAGSNTCSTFRF